MSWLSELISRHEPRTFEQELELLIARWTDFSRKGNESLTIKEIGNRLLDKAEKLLDERRGT